MYQSPSVSPLIKEQPQFGWTAANFYIAANVVAVANAAGYKCGCRVRSCSCRRCSSCSWCGFKLDCTIIIHTFIVVCINGAR